MFKNMKVIDAHIHYALPVSAKRLAEIMDETATDMANLVTIPDRARLSNVPDALMAKTELAGRLYVFGGLDVSEYFIHRKTVGKHFVKYVKRILACGCDGVKLIEGKPELRGMLPIPDFDLPCWEPFWAFAEQTQLPIIWHVNDPEEFWDPEKVPSWAKDRGWFYGEDVINNEAQYTQVLNVLARHPKLRITFAHFFFMSAQLPRLQKILDACPNVRVDLTPGIEMYANFSRNIEKTREFFIKNQDRIIYGTDIGARYVLDPTCEHIDSGESLQRAQLVRGYLDTKGRLLVKGDGNFLIGTEDFELETLGLDEDIQRKLYSGNFVDFAGTPRAVCAKKTLRECRRLKRVMHIVSLVDKSMKPDYLSLEGLIRFFNK